MSHSNVAYNSVPTEQLVSEGTSTPLSSRASNDDDSTIRGSEQGFDKVCVEGDDWAGGALERGRLHSLRSWYRRWTFASSTGFLLAVICLGVSMSSLLELPGFRFHAPDWMRQPSRQNMGACGSTAEIARSRGCHFDLILASWVKDECFDRELYHDYVHDGFNTRNWTFWWDKENTRALTKEEALSGDWETVYVDADYHYAHCAYFWSKQWKQLMTGGGVVALTERERKDGHTQHCIRAAAHPNVTKFAEVAPVTANQQHDLMDCIIGPM